MKKRLFKYIKSKYVDDIVKRGKVLFWNLTYFRLSEEDGRGDLYEGRHVDRPGKGVQITSLQSGSTVEGDFAFVNAIDTQEIYVFCLSTRHSPELYDIFNADACVEITSAAQFIKDCRKALSSSC
jgi:hypothetical protein